jgi:hypothetical protein
MIMAVGGLSPDRAEALLDELERVLARVDEKR